MIRKQRERIAYYMITPALILVLLLNLLPLVQGVIVSMQNQNMLRPDINAFVGFKHYIRALFVDPEFWATTGRTIYWTIGSVVGAYFVSLGLALLLNIGIRGRGLFRALFLIPWVIPDVVTALLWKWFYSSQFGMANFALMKLGLINSPVLYLSNANAAMPSVIVVQIWKLYPIMTVVLLAALQGVPKELHEAAKIDGANAWQRFWFVTLNFLRPSSMIIVLLGCIWTFQSFDIIYLLTGGGPAKATQTLAVMVYAKAFWASEFGYASAIGVILLMFLLVLGLVYQLIDRATSRENAA